VTGAIDPNARSSVLIEPFLCRGDWCNWHIENLIS
jgi:hypothetical protein